MESMQNTKSRLTILIATPDIIGRMNACAGATIGLLRRGHRVVFMVEQAFAGRHAALGFEEYVYGSPKPDEDRKEPSSTNEEADENKAKPKSDKVAHGMFANRCIGPYSSLEKFRNLLQFFTLSPTAGERIKATDRHLREAIRVVAPDLIWVDNSYLPAAIAASGIPWIMNVSVAPTYVVLDETYTIPPGGSGYSTADTDKSSWLEFNRVRREFFYSTKLNDTFQELGYDRFPDNLRIPPTASLTVYAYPRELNYSLIEGMPNWINLECFNKCSIVENRRKKTLQELATDICGGDQAVITWLARNGHVIYVSLGTMGSIDLRLMRWLVDALSRTAHKYIISMGPKFAEIELADNMIGVKYVPQLDVLPLVDCVVTHGGNNTICETIAVAGVPMIVMPLFADQFDNAFRVHDRHFGHRFDPYSFDDQRLIELIDAVLRDTAMRDRVRQASERIRADNRVHEELWDRVERIALRAKSTPPEGVHQR